MPLRNLRPLTFRPSGLSDALDGTNVFAGAMKQLSDLVPAPSTPQIFIPRCAAEQQTNFSGFSSPETITACQVIGTRVYGFIGSARFAGYDEPFVFDIEQGAFITIAGVTADNVPLTPLTTGDWTPPTIAAPTNSRILFTHPGFTAAGILTPYFGWLDVSGFQSVNFLKGNTTSGSKIITSINDGFTSAPIIDGVQPGQILDAGAGFSGPVTVISCANGTFDLSTVCNTDGTFILTHVANLGGVEPGMGITGPTIAVGSSVVSVDMAAGTVLMSLASLANATTVDVNFSGGGTITVSAAATSTVVQTPLTVNGGTVDKPLWGAGNTNTYPLAHIPTAVGSYNGRAWFAVGPVAVFSDSLNATQVTNSYQALFIGDHTNITAFAGLPFVNTVTGGAQAALIVFKGPQPIFQITGDAATSNLAVNAIEGSVGTLAPNTITNIPEGLAFIAVDGLRILGLNGQVTPPIGAYGKGVSVPFIFAQNPSRMCMAYNQNTLRVSLQRGDVFNTPWQEFCFEMTQRIWTGPHSFPYALLQGYTADRVGFVGVGINLPHALWFHTLVPVETSSYVENGQPMNWAWETCLLPDNQQLAMNRMLDTKIAALFPPGSGMTVSFKSEAGNVLDSVPVGNVTPANNPLWGGVKWGSFIWGSIPSYLVQYRVAWDVPLIFKQGTVRATGASLPVMAIGNLYMGFQPLPYLEEDLPAVIGYTGLETMDTFTALTAMDLGSGNYTCLLATVATQGADYP